MAESDLTVPCLRCGRPASPHLGGEHHQPPDRSSIGMGGSSLDHDHERVPLCRLHHQMVHDKKLVVVRQGAVAWCVDPKTGEVLSVRALAPEVLQGEYGPADVDAETLASFLPRLDDDSLAWLWDCGVRWEEQGVLFEALAAKGFRDRYGSYGDEWFKRAGDLIREKTGRPIAVGTVYDRANLALSLEASGWRMELLENLGRSVLAEAAKNEDPVRALELASEMRDHNETSGAIVKELMQTRRKHRPKFSDDENVEPEQVDQVWARCPECKHVGWMDRLPAPEACVLAEAREVVEGLSDGCG